MATGKKNILIRSIRGRVGDFIIKQYAYGTVITRRPDMSGAGSTKKQQAVRSRFKKAVAFAQSILANNEERKRYKRIKGKGSAYNKAIAAYLKAHK